MELCVETSPIVLNSDSGFQPLSFLSGGDCFRHFIAIYITLEKSLVVL